MSVFLARLDLNWLSSSWERVLEAAVRGAWHQRGRYSTGVCLPRELENQWFYGYFNLLES